MKKVMIALYILGLLVFASTAIAEQQETMICNLVSVYDGDTFKCNIDGLHPIIGKNISIRLYGADTPEIRGKSEREKALAIDAKHYTLNALSNANIIELRNVSRGKYFRIVAEVYYDGHCLSDGLIDAGLAYKYSGGTKKSW